MDTPQQDMPAVGPTPAQIDPAVIARLDASPSGEIDIPQLLLHMAEGGPEKAAEELIQAARGYIQDQQRPIYPAGSTAVCDALFEVVTIINRDDLDDDYRRVSYKPQGAEFTQYTRVHVDKLSQSDDPATVAALATKAVKKDPFAKGRWAIYKSPDGEIYVKIKDVSEDQRQRQITYIDDIYAAEPYAEHWVDIKELKPVLYQEGEMALYNGQVARVEEVEEDRRRIVYLKETEYMASDTQLKPILADDHAGLEIAQLEINLAKQRDKMQAKIEDLDYEIKRLTANYDAKLKAQLDISNALMRDLEQANHRTEEEKARRIQAQEDRLTDRAKLTSATLRIGELREMMHDRDQGPDEDGYLEHLIMASNAELKGEIDKLKAQIAQQPQRQKVEIKTLEQFITGIDRIYIEPGSGNPPMVTSNKDLADIELAHFLNDGWKTIPELCGVISMADGSGSYTTRLVTLQREVQDEAHPPMEVEVKRTSPTTESLQAPAPDEDGDNHPDHDYDEVDSEIPDLVHQEPVMSIELHKPRPVLPAQAFPNARQISQGGLAAWKADQNEKLLQVGSAAYHARLKQWGIDDDDELRNLTRPPALRSSQVPMIIMGQA